MKTAILGATGLVGRTMLACLARCDWADEEPLLLCGKSSDGCELAFGDRLVRCCDAAGADFAGVELALFSAGAEASRRFGPLAQQAGAWVVDNSSAFRLEPTVPLVVPEINGRLVPRLGRDGPRQGGIIANPNCSTIQIALAVAPLQAAFGLREVHVTTLQSVSGAGQRALDQLQRELACESGSAGDGGEVFPQPIAANVIPAIGPALPDGSFAEETKVVAELRKILDLPALAVSCTATRVAVERGHGAAVRVVLQDAATPAAAAEVMAAWPGLEVEFDPHRYLTPRQIAGRIAVHVGRLRADPVREDALLFWVVADNLLKGAAWNAVQIADLLAGK